MRLATKLIVVARMPVPEIVEHGQTGLICDHPSELPAALRRVQELNPCRCLRRVGERFDASRMAQSYERLYRAVARADMAPAKAS